MYEKLSRVLNSVAGPCTSNNPLFLLSHFQILICNELLFLFPFFQPLKKVCLQTEILGNLFASSSPCRKDQFAVLYFSTSLIVLIQAGLFEAGLIKITHG